MNTFIKFTILFVSLTSISALNILGIFPYQGKSHFFVHEVFLRELANKGHNLTVISYFPLKDAPKNYRDITLVDEKIVVEAAWPFERSYWIVIQIVTVLSIIGRENCDVMLSNKQVQDMIAQKPKFDVVIIEHFNSDCALGIAYKLKAPVVATASHILMPWQFKRFGIPNNPSYVPYHFLGGGTKPTLYQRIERLVFDFLINNLYYYICQKSNQESLAKYFDDIPPLEDLAREIKFLLLYQNFVLTQSRLFPSNVIEVGGYHVTKAKPLTGELKTFMENANNGVIYISFGSLVKDTDLTPEKIQAILDTIIEMPQRFVWKLNDKSKAIKDKLYCSEWLPQIDILGHNKTVAFFSHSGMGSTTESIHYGVPMVAMPILGDQPSNAASVEESGLGVQIQMKDLTKDNLIKAFKKVLDPRFRQQVTEVSRAWHDRPMSPLDTAVFWTEFAARNTNFTFRSAAADVPFYQYMFLDIGCLVMISLLGIIFSIKTIISFCIRKNSLKTGSGKNKTVKNKKSKHE
uniref:UDP-glucuronosyltransferase n=1 Tax=Zygaena filipendulae TaxID=287375 RepID=A0A286MXP4_9NEOP|nr:UDP-glycosyltransferase UGT42D1 [Zygaena filipendulae]